MLFLYRGKITSMKQPPNYLLNRFIVNVCPLLVYVTISLPYKTFNTESESLSLSLSYCLCVFP